MRILQVYLSVHRTSLAFANSQFSQMQCSQHHLFAALSWGKRVWEKKKMAASNINAALKLLIVTAPSCQSWKQLCMPKIERQRRIAKAEQIGRVISFGAWLHLSGLILRCLMGTRLLLGQRKSIPFTALVESYCTAPYTAKGSLPLTCRWSQMVNSSSLCQKAIHMTASQILWGKRTVLAQDSFSKSFINKWSSLPFSSSLSWVFSKGFHW